jgi:hypothetical protein
VSEEEKMLSTLRDVPNERRYDEVLDTLEKGSFWPRDWAARQYAGLIITAMCYAVVEDEHVARRYAVMRVLETFLEHRLDLAPTTPEDLMDPRSRVAHLAIPSYKEQCEPWLDILEYMQLRNWSRKGIHEDLDREGELRRAIETEFSHEVLEEVEASAAEWWIR